MNHYTHLTIVERETIFKFQTLGYSVRKIAHHLKRNHSTISRELKRTSPNGSYSPIKAQTDYQKNRENCGRKALLTNPDIWQKVRYLFVNLQWSPEEISQRLNLEKVNFSISYNTIYRGIYAGLLETEKLSKGNRGLIRQLRQRGKTR